MKTSDSESIGVQSFIWLGQARMAFKFRVNIQAARVGSKEYHGYLNSAGEFKVKGVKSLVDSIL